MTNYSLLHTASRLGETMKVLYIRHAIVWGSFNKHFFFETRISFRSFLWG